LTVVCIKRLMIIEVNDDTLTNFFFLSRRLFQISFI